MWLYIRQIGMFYNPQVALNYLIGILIKFARPINFGFEFITHIDFLFYDINHTTSHPFFAIAIRKLKNKFFIESPLDFLLMLI